MIWVQPMGSMLSCKLLVRAVRDILIIRRPTALPCLQIVTAASYEFTMVDIGNSGRQCDWSMYTNGYLDQCVEGEL